MSQGADTLDVEKTAKSSCEQLRIVTEERLQFVDLTDQIKAIVWKSGISTGFVNVQTRHTTTGIIINEHEPLLLCDMKDLLDRLVPDNIDYRHDDFSIRTANLTPDERSNGFAHCRALFLRASECINLLDGELQLGIWQRIFLLELDGPRERNVSVMILGS
ncbi:MAG: secondary thiamine-phosphate synthase enzyme YjbQ [Acidobacteriota bacterium]